MLPKRQRLKKAFFGEIFKGGSRLSSPLFSVVYKKVMPIGPSRFSAVVSKKIAQGAAERNRIRRRIYGALEDIYRDFGAGADNLAVIVSARDGKILKIGYKILKEELRTLLKKLSGRS